MPNPPRLLYLGDVPVESSYHGSALLYRLLQTYPPDCLRIIEAGLVASLADRRLPGVTYSTALQPGQRWLHTRLHRWVSAAFSLAAPRRVQTISNPVVGFQAEAVLTVAHGYSWITAAAYARRHRLPLHFIVHDDWPRTVGDVSPVRRWVEKQFARCYREAASRLCVSPFMVEDYRRRYGIGGTVLYPSRAADCPVFDAPPERLSRNDHPFTVAFGGTINSPGYVRSLKAIARALEVFGGRLLIFGPLTKDTAQRNGLAMANIMLCGLVSSGELMVRFREEADVLFVPMSFNPADRPNMELSFPSKLTDYTAVGLPLLIYGPDYCSAVRWARENPGVAEIVDAPASEALIRAIKQLANDVSHRTRLGRKALEVGQNVFAHNVVFKSFCNALSN